MDKVDILEQINHLCNSWTRFANQLEPEDAEVETDAGLKILSDELQERFTKATKLIAALKKGVEEHLKQP